MAGIASADGGGETLRWIVFAAGLSVVAATYVSVVGTMIVPRDTEARLAGLVARVVLPAFRKLSRLFRSYEAKDDFLAQQAPWFLLVLLAVWVLLLITGFALMLYGAVPLPIGTAYREAGSSFLTLGFATSRESGATAIDLFAAGSGLVIVAMLIGYLPTLYSSFNRRETLVTMLESRAGSPAWGPEILWRHQRIGIMDSLPDFYEKWELWCADVAESHSSYPVLLFVRSPDPLRSWLTGLLAVLDSAALYNALCPNSAPSQTRLCLRMGFTCLRNIATAIGVPYDADPKPDAGLRLTHEEYLRGTKRLIDIGFPIERSPEEAWADFQGWRVNYEEIAIKLSERVLAVPGPWSLTETAFGGMKIPMKRPVDRTPDEPEGTKFTREGTYEEL
jgi:hypothetical protein